MARTYEANVILGLKDQLTKGAPKAAASVDLLSNALDKAEKKAREFAATTGKMPKWGSSFQRQLDRLRLAPAEIERIKSSWTSLNREISKNSDKAFQTTAVTRWKNETLASILEIREAHRQLSADAVKEAKAQAAAEKALAAEAAREKARLAKEAARQGQQAVREAAREAVQAAREAARAERTAQQDTVRAAREAAREKERLAREAARVAKEEARTAAAEARRLEREAARARRAALREESRERRRLVGWGSDTVRNLGYAAGLGGGTYMLGRGVRGTALSAAELEREKARDYLGGLTPADTARLQARAFQTSAQVRSVDAATMHNLLRETSLTTVGIDGAMQLAPDLARSMAVVSSMKSPDEALSALTRLLRGLDTLGKNVDVDVIRGLLDGFTRAQGVEGAEFNVGDVYTVAKRSKSGGFALNERFLTRIMPALISDLGADQTGTALGSGVSQVIGGRATKASKSAQRSYGLRDKKGNFLDQGLFLTDPFEYTLQKLMPALKAKGVDPTDEVAVTAAMSKLFSNQRVADLFGRMVLQAEQYLIKERKMNQAPGTAAGDDISSRDPFVAAAGAIDQLKNAVGALVEPLNPTAIAGMNMFADSMARIAAWAKGQGQLSAGNVAVGGGVAAAGAFGVYKLWSAFSGGFGLQASAAALNSSAAALTAAAAKLGGAGSLPGGPGMPVSPGKLGATGTLLGVGAAAYYGQEIAAAAIEYLTGRTKEQQDSSRAAATEKGWEEIKGGLSSGYNFLFGGDGAVSAGAGIGSDLVAGIQQSGPEVEAASMSIFDRIRAIFSSGIDVPIRPTMGAVPAAAGRLGVTGLGMDSATGRATGPGRASGGSVYAGGLYQINEFGQEFFVPSQSGSVVPAGRGGKGPAGPITFHISGSKEDAAEIANSVRRELRGVFGDYGLDFA